MSIIIKTAERRSEPVEVRTQEELDAALARGDYPWCHGEGQFEVNSADCGAEASFVRSPPYPLRQLRPRWRHDDLGTGHGRA